MDIHYKSVQLSLYYLIYLLYTSLSDLYINIITLLFKHRLNPNSRILLIGEIHLISIVREGNESRVKFLLKNSV